MKIAIPTDNNNMNSNICISFGRAPYFLFYDTDNEKSKFVENTAAESAGGAGIKAAQIIADNNAEVLITPRCGENAADVLKQSKIKMFKSEGNNILDNINAFNDKKLSPLNEIHGGYHRRGKDGI